MSRRFLVWLAIGLAGLETLQVQATRAQSSVGVDRRLLDTYCTGCHNDREQVSGLALDRLDPNRIGPDAAVWEKVVQQIRVGTMPPVGQPRPDRAATLRFADNLEAAIDREASLAPDPGRPVLHRLNRTEYANAIRHLLDLDIDVTALLPPDESLEGFDNVGGALSMSPALLERYLSAARRISRLAVGDPTMTPAFASSTYEAPQDVWQNTRMDEDLPFGSRGGMTIRHRFPLDGEYVCRIRLRRNILGYVRGLDSAHALDVRLDGKQIKSFTVGGERVGAPAPLSFSGVIPGDPAWEAYAVSADANLEVRFQAAAGTRVVGVSFIEELVEEDGVQDPPLTGLGFSYDESRTSPTGPWGPAVESVEIEGPFSPRGPGETTSRTRIFTCRPTSVDVEQCARTILSAFSRRAYRRPVEERDVQPLMGFFRTGFARAGFEEGIRTALERMLVDPSFLFRVERDPEAAPSGAVYRLSDLELASRLSFFLWSSLPDDELLEVANTNTLHDPPVLERQVSRMLADRRAIALVDNFAAQWLSLRHLREVAPDPELFPDFDGNLRDAFLQETRLFLESQLRDDRSLLDLLTANYTFVNERLARHYEIPNVYGSQFRRVTVSNRARGGLLGHGSILTATSYPTRTSPVLRGRWLLDAVLGSPPPPPPPDIPPFPSSATTSGSLSVRARTEQHRTNPSCASCHVRMDPLGFAFENFDAVGRWRATDESGAPVDSSGALPDGTRFSGVEELRAVLVREPEPFVRNATTKLLAYAVGRSIAPSDMPAIRKIVRDAASDRYRWSSIIHGVVRSVPFQMRRSAS